MRGYSLKFAVFKEDIIDLSDELVEEFIDTAKEGVKEAAAHLQSKVREQLSKRSGPLPAPPGEPPAKQKGDLLKSFKILPVRVRGRVVSSGIYSDHPAAARLEWGKVDSRGIRTFPHPYLEPAAREAEDGITDILNRIVS